MNTPVLPDKCLRCNKVCLPGDCEHRKARDAYYSNPIIRARILGDILNEPVNQGAE